jgi:tRNA (cytosine49-C5)-methyltransferase
MQEHEVDIKPKFKEHYSQLTDWDAFIHYSLQYLRRSIRINTLKTTIPGVKKSLEEKDWILTPIPWCSEGFWVKHKEDRRDIGNTEEHSLGYFYVQEAASMIPPLALQPQKHEKVLDMCASPGSKTSQLCTMMQNRGIIVANDYKGMRLAPLGLNMQRIGATNVIITLMQGQWFKKAGIMFDKILVDAPCSGTGTIRKSFKTLKIWNLPSIRRLAAEQRQLITTAFEILKPGGTMVYSTCSCEPLENEAIIHHLLTTYNNAKVEPFKLPIKTKGTIKEYEGTLFDPSIKDCLRLWPQDNDTEGFFVARIKKETEQ